MKNGKIETTDFDLIDRSSNFTLSLLSFNESLKDMHKVFKIHKTFLKPLLASSDGCWAYGIEKDTEIWEIAKDILSPSKGKYKVDLSGDPVKGREYFWNANGGKRGTILISVPVNAFDALKIFSECNDFWVSNDYRSGHSISAINNAHKVIEDGSHLVFCLPGNNGIQWCEFFAPKPLIFDLYKKAKCILQKYDKISFNIDYIVKNQKK